ncbi:MAG: hypothetical protein ACK54J_14695 [Pseudanabaena sp.]|jgi:hypothetical protein
MKELYSGVDYYGLGEIIKEYANFPKFLPLPVGIQHGWTSLIHTHDVRYDAAENWFWTRDLEIKYQIKFKGLNTRTVGSPFLYLLKNLGYVEPIEKQGSIVFPAHSSRLCRVEYDYEEYALMLGSLPDEYKPITVCMYHLDMDLKKEIPFLKRGFKIVNNGNSLYDNNFLKNFVANAHGKRYALSNQVTSALLFASAMGLTSFFYETQLAIEVDDPDLKTLEYIENSREWEERVSQYFQFNDCNSQQQKQFALSELGQDFLLSPRDMNIILYRCLFSKYYFYKLIRRLLKNLVNFFVPINS